jgi:hypothetical protein
VTSSPDSPASHAADEDVEMLLFANPLGDTPYSTTLPAHAAADTDSSQSQSTSLPDTSALATSHQSMDSVSEVPEIPYPFSIDDDARSDTSMPPLYDASDSEYEEDHIHHGENDLTSESDIDAYDVEMTLLVDDGDLSDYEDSVIPNEGAPALSSTPFAAMDSDTSRRRVVVEEVEDRDQQRTGE